MDKKINENKINLKDFPTLKTEWIFQYENSCWDLKGKTWSITACLFTHWPFLSIPSPFCWEPRVRSQEVSSSHFMTWPSTHEDVKLWPFSHLQMVSLLVFFSVRLLCIVYPLWVGPVICGSIHHDTYCVWRQSLNIADSPLIKEIQTSCLIRNV